MSVNLVPTDALFTSEEEQTLQSVNYIGIVSLIVITIVAITFLIAGQLLARQRTSLENEITQLDQTLQLSKDKEILYRSVKLKATQLSLLEKKRLDVANYLQSFWQLANDNNASVFEIAYSENLHTIVDFRSKQIGNLKSLVNSAKLKESKISLIGINNYSHKSNEDYILKLEAERASL